MCGLSGIFAQMAKKQIVQLIDDLDGAVLESGDGVTIQFALDGRSYEIDLSHANAEKLRGAFKPFIDAATLTSPAPRSARSRSSRSASTTEDLNVVREWARANGHTVSDRGRVPAAVLEAYRAAH